MSGRPWHRVGLEAPPVSTEGRRYWLELWVPERVQGKSLEEKRKGLVLGVYLGDGNFRLQGERNFSLEMIERWRPLAGNATPVVPEKQTHGKKTEVH